MKKLVIATAVASALMAGAAAADTTVYGRLNISYTMDDDGAGTETAGLQNEASRFGMKGSEDLGNGMSAVYQIEYGVSAETQGSNASLRVGMVGLKGDFGTFAMGTMWTPSYLLVRGNADPFNAIGANVYAGNFPAATRAPDAVAYINKFGDVDFAAAIVTSDATDDAQDAFDIAVSIPVGPVTVGIAAADIKDKLATALGTAEHSPTAVSVKYAGGAFSASAVMLDTDNAAGDTWTSVTVAFDMTAKNTITLQMEDDENDTGTNVGISHALSKRTTAFLEIQSGDLDGDETAISLKHNF